MGAASSAITEIGGKVAKRLGDGLMAAPTATAEPELEPPAMPRVEQVARDAVGRAHANEAGRKLVEIGLAENERARRTQPRDVVPACRTLDCVSLLALTVDDAMTALSAIAGADPADPFSHPRQVHPIGAMPGGLRLGVPIVGQRLFFGDSASEAAYEEALTRFAGLGAKIAEIDIEPFYAAARLLYEGPWVAERYPTARALIASSPEALHPVTRQVILAGAHGTAADAFAAFYQLAELRHGCERAFSAIDALLLPTAPTSSRSSGCSPTRSGSTAGSAPTPIS